MNLKKQVMSHGNGEFLINIEDEISDMSKFELDRSSSRFELNATAWTAIFIGLSRDKSDAGRKDDIGDGISKLKKERRSCNKRSKGNMSRRGKETGSVGRSDGEKLISRRLCRCTAPY